MKRHPTSGQADIARARGEGGGPVGNPLPRAAASPGDRTPRSTTAMLTLEIKAINRQEDYGSKRRPHPHAQAKLTKERDYFRKLHNVSEAAVSTNAPPSRGLRHSFYGRREGSRAPT